MTKFAVIFDMDGVLVNSEPHYDRLIENLLAQFNLQLSHEVRQAVIGTSMPKQWQIIKSHYHIDKTIDELCEMQEEAVLTQFPNYQETMFEDVLPFIRHLAHHQVPMIIASSSSPALIEKMLNETGIKQYIKQYISGLTLQESKPHPEIFLKAAQMLDKLPSQCMIIEDSQNGLLAAQAANIFRIGRRHLHAPIDEQLANIMVDSLSELDYNKLQIILKNRKGI